MSKATKHIVLGVTGSIAAYKAAEIVRLLVKKEWTVSVVMTRAATRFVGELTFRSLSRRPVTVDMFDMPQTWEAAHVSLAEAADAFLVAPCTANVIAKMALGIADDALTATALACPAPLVIAPAMNEKMWKHPATRENIGTLKKRGAMVVDVESGDLACGYSGEGRMASPAAVVSALENVLH